ncbi:MAG: TRAM domain-containing protein, partial [Nocardioides sp.]|nr:TRAM domain-containing protein [Nocardioides sp.]
MSRPVRQRRPRGKSRVGERFTVEVGPVAHGGSCVARLPEPDSRVVFVRHALPGERVVVEVTEGTEGDRFWRGDAVEVLTASPERVAAPCPVAGPGGCGGCDFQHVDVAHQRVLKAAVVREQLVRLGRLAPEDPRVAGLVVEAVPVDGRDDGLGWRTRQRYARLPDGSRAMRKHRSHDLVPVDTCLIAHPDADRPVGPVVEEVVEAAGERHEFRRAGNGFWQVHPEAARVLVEAVLDALDPRPGERAMDLYSGVGLFARFLSSRIGSGTRLVLVEADREASRHALANLAGHDGVEVACGPTDRVLESSYDEPFDLVVLDPPREGARRAVVEQVADRRPRAVAYVACDPAALGRDVALFAEQGYELTSVRAFDLFPMTHHIECV